MLAYNSTFLDELRINEAINEAHKKRLVTDSERIAVTAFHSLKIYQPNIFIRIGLFLATVVVLSMSFGLLTLMIGSIFSSDKGYGILCAAYALVIFALLEYLIRTRNHYKSGVDDALLWVGAAFTLTSLILLVNNHSALTISLYVFALSIICSVRYANALMSAIAFFAFLSVLFNSLINIGTIAKVLMPFAIMVLSAGIYFIIIKIKTIQRLRHYSSCFLVVEFLSLVCIYSAVNYFVVRELSNEMFNLRLTPGASITGGWFFWTMTALIPLFYLYRSLQKKDALMLRVSLLLIAASLYTAKHYYLTMPAENLLVIAGLALILTCYFLTRYLNTPRHGFTSTEPNKPEVSGLLQVESLVISETFNQPTIDSTNKFEFGGGSSGGGGATGNF